jgi:3-keto-5-aminohexanoate cleavage enzyme
MLGSFIINVCLTGTVPTRAMSPHVPMTPAEIARDVESCVALGASMVHIHARDEAGAPEWRREGYQTILDAVRRAVPEVVVCVSTSGRNVSDPARRMACLDCEPRPDMASLTLGSIDFLRDAALNSLSTVSALAEGMKVRGIKPELEIFDVGMARLAARLASQGILTAPLYANLLLGNVSSAAAEPLDLAAILRHLPPGVIWAGAGIGRDQLTANTLGILFGHGVRVGLEDNLYYDERKAPATNPGLVERVVRLAGELGRRPATIAETRALLGLGTGSIGLSG